MNRREFLAASSLATIGYFSRYVPLFAGPSLDTPRNPLAGIHVNTALEVDMAATLGVGIVRVAQTSREHYYALARAKELGLTTIYAHVPDPKDDFSFTKLEIASIFRNPVYQLDFWEVANEPDQKAQIGRDRYTELFAHTVKERSASGRNEVKLIMAAIMPKNFRSYLQALSQKGITPDAFAIHAYQDPKAISDLLDFHLNVLSESEFSHLPKRLVITEWGLQGDKSCLLDGFAAAAKQNVPTVYYELPDWNGWGLFTPKNVHPVTKQATAFDPLPAALDFAKYNRAILSGTINLCPPRPS